MTERFYRVVFNGRILSGHDVERVKRNLAHIFNLSEGTVENLFSGRRVVVKRDIRYEKALALKAKFTKAGALCEIQPPRARDERAGAKPERTMRGPKCVLEQTPAPECAGCGIIVAKYKGGHGRERAGGASIADQPAVLKPAVPASANLCRPVWRPAVLFVITFGGYFPFWFYGTWKHLRDHQHLAVRPLKETLFLLIPIYNFFVVYKLLRTVNEEAAVEGGRGFDVRSSYLMLAVPYVFSLVIEYLGVEGPYWMCYCFSAWPLAGIQGTLNAHWRKRFQIPVIRPLALGYKIAVVLFLFLFTGTEVYQILWNNAAKEAFSTYTREKIDALITAPSDKSASAIQETFKDFVLYGKGLMNDRRLYKKNAMLVLNTVLNRLARAVSLQDINIDQGPAKHLTQGSAVYKKMQEAVKQHQLYGSTSAVMTHEDRRRALRSINTQRLLRALIDHNKYVSKDSKARIKAMVALAHANTLKPFRYVEGALPFNAK